jgi:hypothetical protein
MSFNSHLKKFSVVHSFCLSESYGEHIKTAYRCDERLKVKTGESKRLAHTRWSGGRADLSRGKWIGGESFV